MLHFFNSTSLDDALSTTAKLNEFSWIIFIPIFCVCSCLWGPRKFWKVSLLATDMQWKPRLHFPYNEKISPVKKIENELQLKNV